VLVSPLSQGAALGFILARRWRGEPRFLRSIPRGIIFLVRQRFSHGATMIQVTIPEAQQQLPELLSKAAEGQEVAIRGDNGRTFRLIVDPPRPPVTGVPKAGSCKGLIEIADDFDEPLEELREYWE